mgnify:CR=1 FL=1
MSTYSVIYNTNPYQKAQIRTQTQKKARIRAVKKKQALKRQIFGIAVMFLTILATVLVSTSCRTTEGVASRFTVCPLWPLGKSPILIFKINGTYRARTCDPLLVRQMLSQLS